LFHARLLQDIAVKAEVGASLDASIFDAVIASGSAESRRQLARELAGLTANPETPQSERQVVIPSILKLAIDPVLDVRRTLAEGLAVAEKIHPDIVFTIVADEDEIALPFISAVVGLHSSVMVAIARAGDVARQMQIALRADVSPDAVDYIAAKCALPVCVALFDNPAVQLEDRHYRILYTRFGYAPQVVERLLGCENLPLDIRILQARRASNRVHQLMAERGWVPANDAAEIVADAEETAVLNILTGATPEELHKTIRFLTAKNMLTPSIVMRAACLGEMEIVERALAHLCDMPAARTAQLIYGRGPVSLRALYKKAGLPPNCFWLLRAAIDIERDIREEGHAVGSGDFGRRLIEALMTRYEGMSMGERTKQLEIVSRFAEEQVRLIARRLKTDLVRAA
jgi:uncharacterized protein (DUF2336 family)